MGIDSIDCVDNQPAMWHNLALQVITFLRHVSLLFCIYIPIYLWQVGGRTEWHGLTAISMFSLLLCQWTLPFTTFYAGVNSNPHLSTLESWQRFYILHFGKHWQISYLVEQIWFTVSPLFIGEKNQYNYVRWSLPMTFSSQKYQCYIFLYNTLPNPRLLTNPWLHEVPGNTYMSHCVHHVQTKTLIVRRGGGALLYDLTMSLSSGWARFTCLTIILSPYSTLLSTVGCWHFFGKVKQC